MFPIAFEIIFDFVDEFINYYYAYQKLAAKQIGDALDYTKNEFSNLTDIIAKAAAKDAAQIAAEEAVKRTEILADQARVIAEAASIQVGIAEELSKDASKRAANAAEVCVEAAIKEKMSDVTSKISETSVTILGMFTGIVLAVVAGLFYSSSVLESIASANIFKLACIASLAGLVCVFIISVMFRYIYKIRDNKSETEVKYEAFNTNNNSVNEGMKKPQNNKRPIHKSKATCVDLFTVIVACFLIFVTIVGGICYFVFPDNNSNNISPSEKIDIDVSAGINNDNSSLETNVNISNAIGNQMEKETVLETSEDTVAETIYRIEPNDYSDIDAGR